MRARQPERRPAPSTSCVTCCASISRTISAAASSPARRRKVPPSDRVSASASLSTARVSASTRPVLRLDDEHEQLGIRAAREPGALPDETAARGRAAADRDEHALCRGRARVTAPHLGRSHLGHLVQGHGAQRREVLGREEPRQCLLDARFRIHEAARDPLAQRVRAEVDEPDLVGAVQQPVGERLADVDAREREDAIAQALQVLDVDRRPDLDPALEQVLDILVAFAPSCARSIRVGQLVDARDRRAPFDDPLDVGLARGQAAASPRRCGAPSRCPRARSSVRERPCASR